MQPQSVGDLKNDTIIDNEALDLVAGDWLLSNQYCRILQSAHRWRREVENFQPKARDNDVLACSSAASNAVVLLAVEKRPFLGLLFTLFRINVVKPALRPTSGQFGSMRPGGQKETREVQKEQRRVQGPLNH